MTNLTESTFDDFMAHSDKPVVVDFWASWCAPCQMLGPVLEELNNEMADKVAIVKVNIDENSGLAARFKISSIPAVHIFKKGASVANNLGFMPKENYKQFISSHL